MAMDVGSVFVRLGAKTDRKGFEEFERDVVRVQKVKDISVRLGADVDDKGFAEYERKLAAVREKAKHREAFKATLGADYDGRAFNAWWRDMEKAKVQAKDTNSIFDKLTKSMTNLGGGGGGRGFFGALLSGLGSVAAAGAKAGESLGGSGGGLIGAIAGLGGAAAGGAVALGGLLAIFAALAGAAVALVGSLGAAAAGLAAVGIGASAALGPLAALAGAVVQRFGVIVDAYKALDTQQSKGAVQAQGVAQAQQAAAQRIQSAEQGVITAKENVQKAEDNLTAARFKARREVEDLATAVTHAAETERTASLTLAEAQKRLTEVQLDPKATLLDRLQAQNGVTQAVQGTTDAHTSYQRALEDRAKGTDTVRVAQQHLNDAVRAEVRAEDQVTQARQSATVAAQKQGAAATDAQQKLAKLSETERHLLTTMQGFVAALQAMFKPATDAIFNGIDGALKRLEPVLGGFTGRFHALGTAIGSIIDSAAKSLAGPEWGRALDAFIATSQKIVKPISDTVGSVLVILRNIAVAAQPLVVEFANWMAKALGGLADKTKDAGRMRDIIRSLAEHTKSWAELTFSVSRLLFTIFSSGAKDGKSLVDWLRQMVDHWNAFLNTKEGQRRLHEFFRNAIDLTKKIFTALGDIVGVFLKISTAVLKIGTHLGGVAKFIKDNTDLVYGLVAAWVAVKTAILLANGVAAVGVLRGLLPGAAGAAAAGAGAAGAGAAGAEAAAGAGAGGALSRLGGLKGAITGGIVVAGGATIASQLLRGPAGPDTGLLNKYADALERVTKAGDKPGMRKLADQLRDTARANQDLTKGEDLKRFADALDTTANNGGKDLGALADAFAKLPKSTGGNLEQVRTNILKLAQTAGRSGDDIGGALKQAQAHFDDFRKTGSNNLHGLHTATQDNMNFIKRTLGEDSAAGKDALVGNFKLAADAVKQAMADGKVTTRDGMREIRRLMKEELAVYGIKGQAATDYLRLSGKGSGNATGGMGAQRGGYVQRRAGGGWIGARGMISDDVVPIGGGAIAAFGEYLAKGPAGSAVLNRHQAPVADLMLALGGYASLDQGADLSTIERAMGPLGGLDALFSNITRPHYLANGGYVQGAVPAGGPAASALAQEMFAKGFNVTSARRNTSTYHGSAGDGLGDALDFGDSANDLRKVWSVLFPRRASFVELFGPSAFAGLYHGTQKFSDPTLQAGHEDHVHVAIVKKLAGALGSAASRIKIPKVSGGGALGGVVQGALNIVGGAANKRLSQAGNSLPGDELSIGAPTAAGSFNKAALSSLWGRYSGGAGNANLMAAIALAESGGNPKAHNASGATGLWQILGAILPGNLYDPVVNVRNAVAKLKTQGLGAWEAYTNGSYRQYLAGGGRFARGGRPTLKPGGSSPQAAGLSGSGPNALQVGRIAAYDDLGAQITDLGTQYTQADRRYSLTDEILINPTTGEINVDAIHQRASEIDGLIAIRQKILEMRRKMRAIALRVIHTYQVLIDRLTKQLAHMKKGPRKDKALGELAAYQGGRDLFQGNLHDLDVQYIPDALLDVQELQKEKGSVLGTTAQTDTGTAAASASGDTGAAASTPSADVTAVLAQAQANAATLGANLTAANQVIAAFGSPGDIGTGGQNAAGAIFAGAQPMGAQLGTTIAGGGTGAPGGATVINNYNMPGHPEVLRAIGDAATAGQSLQPAVSASVTRLGI